MGSPGLRDGWDLPGACPPSSTGHGARTEWKGLWLVPRPWAPGGTWACSAPSPGAGAGAPHPVLGPSCGSRPVTEMLGEPGAPPWEKWYQCSDCEVRDEPELGESPNKGASEPLAAQSTSASVRGRASPWPLHSGKQAVRLRDPTSPPAPSVISSRRDLQPPEDAPYEASHFSDSPCPQSTFSYL